MRIIRKECRKVLNPKRLLVLAAFTFLYYMMFIYVDDYPTLNDISYRYVTELVREVGPSISPTDLPRLMEKRDELIAKADEIIAANTTLTAAGIDNYAKWLDAYDNLFFVSELSEEEKMLRLEVFALREQEGETQKYISLIQYIDSLEQTPPGIYWGVPATDAEAVTQKYYGNTRPLYLKAMTDFCQRDLSMLPLSVIQLLWRDMRALSVLLIICSFILLVPCQIHERLCEVIPLYTTTYTGRKIFGKQFAAQLLSCELVTALQLLIYTGIFATKGLSIYWKCPAWPESITTLWLDISFGMYMAIYLFMIWLFVMGNTVLTYCIGRCCANYIAGIAMSIPIGGVVSALSRIVFNSPFAFTIAVQVALWEPMVLLAWLVVTGILLVFLLKKDQKRNI